MSTFFFGKVEKSVQADILGSKKLPLLIENIVSILLKIGDFIKMKFVRRPL
jgi:hypothetical protein